LADGGDELGIQTICQGEYFRQYRAVCRRSSWSIASASRSRMLLTCSDMT
jgi:hypothetical protein